MDGAALTRVAIETVRSLPATDVHSFAADWEAARVAGKWFALFSELDDRIVTVKADPADALALTQGFDAITPGYHMNKRHWITIHPHGDVDEVMVADLVRQSYQIVRDALPKSRRPLGTTGA
ncbi:MmcQ/YjbR family DNA-binding protein [Collinsella vaginalis]|uniref:MmcQ/YjbR family DNA-binding protein n=1 Tax=Collinsella vaginalis TaxID=1870987 RepID=UPI000A267588|nr:MmcQ/YjbR family DNA-binding protein [Collinsella vaginalis]